MYRVEAFSILKYHTSIEKNKNKSLALNSADPLSNKQDSQKLSFNHDFFFFPCRKGKKKREKKLAKLLYESLRILEDIQPHDVSDT